jgi:hypothetical protein
MTDAPDDTRDDAREHAGDALSRVPLDYHPALRALLEAELAAGNAISEVGRDFPLRGSVCVQLRGRFRAKPATWPAGVQHIPVNDPHWWMDELRAGDPPHLLVG